MTFLQKLLTISIFLFVFKYAASHHNNSEKPINFENYKKIFGSPDLKSRFILYILTVNGISCFASLVEVSGVQLGITSATCLGASFQNGGPHPPIFLLAPGLPEEETEIYEIRQVVKVVTPNDQTPATSNIVILFIEQPFILSDHLQAVNLPEAFEEPHGISTTLAWVLVTCEVGSISCEPTHPVNFVGLGIQLKLLTDTECAKAWDETPFKYVPDEMFCAQRFEGDALFIQCYLDGIPVISEDGHLIGFVGDAKSVCNPETWETTMPVYVQVSHFVEWIHKEVAAF